MWYVTVDETWIHHYTPKTKRNDSLSNGFHLVSRPRRRYYKICKVMTTICWNFKCIIYANYLEKGKKIIGQYYADLLVRFHKELKKKRRSKKKWCFITTTHHPTHTIAIVTAHPVLSRFSPMIFIFVPWSEKLARGNEIHFEWRDNRRHVRLFCRGPFIVLFGRLKKLLHPWTKCNDLKGNYVEK